MASVSRIDNIKLQGKQRPSLCFLIFFLSLTACGQVTGENFIKSVEENVLRYYEAQNTVCYNFTEKRYFLTGSSLVSHGTVMVYKENKKVFYRGTHTYEPIALKDLKFETVKNRAWFGTNIFRANYFNDYSHLQDKDRFYSFSNRPSEIVKPDRSLADVFSDKSYFTRLTEDKETYCLTLTDTNRKTKGFASNTIKTIKTYRISKKDFSILNYSQYNFWTTEDVSNSDSVVVTYDYLKKSFNTVKSYVDGFIPLTGKKPVPLPPEKDTCVVFPEFSLPDTSGGVKSIDSNYVLVDFWYRACAPCMANIKQLNRLALKQVQVIAINVRDSINDDVRSIVSKYKITFLFRGAELARAMNVEAFPTMYFYDKRRNILFKHIGFAYAEAIEEQLSPFIKD